MHSEEREVATCAGCSEQVIPGADQAFSFGEELVLCWKCAEKRGGRFDADQERWTSAPECSDLISG